MIHQKDAYLKTSGNLKLSRNYSNFDVGVFQCTVSNDSPQVSSKNIQELNQILLLLINTERLFPGFPAHNKGLTVPPPCGTEVYEEIVISPGTSTALP